MMLISFHFIRACSICFKKKCNIIKIPSKKGKSISKWVSSKYTCMFNIAQFCLHSTISNFRVHHPIFHDTWFQVPTCFSFQRLFFHMCIRFLQSSSTCSLAFSWNILLDIYHYKFKTWSCWYHRFCCHVLTKFTALHCRIRDWYICTPFGRSSSRCCFCCISGNMLFIYDRFTHRIIVY